MLAGGAFSPLDVTVGEKLPSMVIFALVLVGEGKIEPFWYRQPTPKESRSLLLCALPVMANATIATNANTILLMLIPPLTIRH